MPNRYVCNVIDEARKCHETRNYSYLPGLLEEIQTLVNRMESALRTQKDVDYYTKEASRLKKEIKALKAEKAELVPDGKKDVDDF